MIDTHCHITPHFEYPDPQLIIQNAQQAGVTKMNCIGCSFDEHDQTLELVRKYPDIVYGSIGLHPESVQPDTDIDAQWNILKSYIITNRSDIFAIGECGFDFHYSQDPIIVQKQYQLFKHQIELSFELNKPLVIHTRDAWDQTFALFDECNIKERIFEHHIITDHSNEKSFPNMDIDLTVGVIHSFTGGPKEALQCIDYGFKLGINGIITFQSKSVDPIREAVKTVGLQNIILETDSPFLSPVPYRGKTNEPSRIKEIAAYVQSLFS